MPVVLITSGAEHQTLTGLELGADDCVPATASGTELAARIRTKIARVPVPAGLVTRDLRTGLLVEQTLLEEAGRELDRGRRVGREGALGVIGIQEMSRLTDRFGAGVASQIFTQVAERIGGTEPLQRLGLDGDGRLLLLLPETGAEEVHRTLSSVATTIASERFTLVGGDTVRLTPVTGWVPFALAASRDQLHGRAVTAMRVAADNLDLQPVRWQPSFDHTAAARRERPLWDRVVDRSRVPLQFLATLVIGVGLPFLGYLGLAAVGYDVSGVAYWVVMAALLITAATIWIEGLYALDPKRPPDEPASAGATGDRTHRGVPAERGGHDHGHRRGVPAHRLRQRPPDPRRLQHPAPARGRGGAGRDGPPRPARGAAEGAQQHLQGPERQRGAEPRDR